MRLQESASNIHKIRFFSIRVLGDSLKDLTGGRGAAFESVWYGRLGLVRQ